MINLTSSGGTITFAFDNNSGYLQNGTIEVPVNSLSLIVDESDMVTFKKANSNDVFVSALASDFGMTKAQLISFYKDSMVGSTGGGTDTGTVQTMIDESISGKADTSAVTQSINAAVSGKADYSAATISIHNETITTGRSNYEQFNIDYSNNVYYISGRSDEEFEGYSIGLKDSPSGNTIFVEMSTSAGETDSYIFTKNSSSFVLTTKGDYKITDVILLPEGEYVSYAYIASNNVEKAVSTVITDDIYPALSGKADTSAVTAVNNVVTAHTANTAIHVTSADKTAWNAKSDFSGSYNDLTDKPTIPTVPTSNTAFTNDAGYITEDALSGYAESSAVTDEITAAVSGKLDTSIFETYSGNVETALSGKQDTLSAGTNITISGNVISAEGGGKAIEAGRGISITTGETADTVSLGFPIWNGGSFNSCVKVCGENNNISGAYSFASGTWTKAQNRGEFASGCYNTSNYSNSTFGNSGNTLFSVGNGTADNARHNAFEIRQNGDIYITSGGTDIKLQDNLGGGSITVDTALDSGSTNPVENRVIYDKFDEVEQVTAAALNNINDRLSEDEEVTAAGLNAVNDKFDGLKLKKLTQAEYNTLATKDASTLYIIVN